MPEKPSFNPDIPKPNKDVNGGAPKLDTEKLIEEILKSDHSERYEKLNKNLPRLETLPREIREAVKQVKEKLPPAFLKSHEKEAEKIGRPVDDLLAVYFLKHYNNPNYSNRGGLRY